MFLLEGEKKVNSNEIRVYDPKKDKLDFPYNYNLEEKNALKELFSEIRNNNKLSINDLRRVALWKINRVLNIPDNVIQNLDKLAKSKKLSIDDSNTKKVISELLDCQGVNVPMASTILKFLRPDIFPILDVRANRALTGKTIQNYEYDLDVYLKYAKKIYDLKDKINLPLHEIDEQLYCFDKKHNGKIYGKK